MSSYTITTDLKLEFDSNEAHAVKVAIAEFGVDFRVFKSEDGTKLALMLISGPSLPFLKSFIVTDHQKPHGQQMVQGHNYVNNFEVDALAGFLSKNWTENVSAFPCHGVDGVYKFTISFVHRKSLVPPTE